MHTHAHTHALTHAHSCARARAHAHTHTGGLVVAVAAGGLHTCAVETSGGLWCWGWNGRGQLGVGSLVDQNRPVAAGGSAVNVP